MPLLPAYSVQWVSGEETWAADTVPALVFRTFLSQAYQYQTVILHINTIVSIANNTYIITYPSKNRTMHAIWAQAWFSDTVVVFISMLQFGQRILAGLGPTGKTPVTITGRQSCKNNTFSQYHHVSCHIWQLNAMSNCKVLRVSGMNQEYAFFTEPCVIHGSDWRRSGW